MHNHRKLEVWQEGRSIVSDVYRVTDGFPPEERFGLVQQIRRAAISIPSNVAEGAGRGTPGDFARFVRIAIGSLCELETQLDVSLDLGYMPTREHGRLASGLASLKRRLAVLEKSLLSR